MSVLETFFGFTERDLAANRSGDLSTSQREQLSVLAQETADTQMGGCALVAGLVLLLAIFAFVLAPFWVPLLQGQVISEEVQEPLSLLLPILGGIIVLVIGLQLWFNRGARNMAQRYRRGKLRRARGTARIMQWGSPDAAGHVNYALRVGGARILRSLAARKPLNAMLFNAVQMGQEYEVYYIGDLLLSIAPVSAGTAAHPPLGELGEVFAFTAADLKENQQGRLSASQVARLRVDSRGHGRGCWIITVIASAVVWLPVVIAGLYGELETSGFQEIAPALLIAGVVVLLMAFATFGLQVQRRVRIGTGRVEQHTGIVTEKRFTEGDSETLASYVVKLEGRDFYLGENQYAVMEQGQRYNLYFIRAGGREEVLSVQPV